jgi:hypothetical protein
MKSKLKKGLVFVAVMLVLCLMSSVASAATIDQALPTPGIAPEGPQTPIGAIAKPVQGKPGIQPDNAIFTDYFDSIYNSYDGYHERGEIYRAGPNGTSYPNEASFTYSRIVASGYTASFDISADVVSAGVGLTSHTQNQ